jgi:hypothetical protein
VRIQHLQIAALQGDRTAIEKLADYASPAFEFRTRQNALRALKALNALPVSLLPHLFEALTSTNTRLSAVARECVEYWMQQARYRQTLLDYYQRQSWTPAEKSLLAPLFEYKPPTFYQRSS